MFAAYFMGSTAWLVEMFALTAPLSGLLIGAGLPTSAERPKAGRVAFVAAACLFIHLTDPVTQIAELGDQQGFARGDAVKRARLVRNWVADGRRELCGLDLRGLDLAEIDLAQADLESSDLSAVNLTDADLGGTNLTGVQLEGANLNGAVLIGALVDDAYGFAEAHCDDETAMPVDWRCNAGHPTPDGADETEDIDG
ncbi:MAG: hypothetical protein DRI90_27750 [Deltaproteobacteria bacterium]|nr:MAG: hypothetical protein DRI90_27750 [Deltaproteobacteria bacterium]